MSRQQHGINWLVNINYYILMIYLKDKIYCNLNTSYRIGGAMIWKIKDLWKNHCLKENLKKITAGWDL